MLIPNTYELIFVYVAKTGLRFILFVCFFASGYTIIQHYLQKYSSFSI